MRTARFELEDWYYRWNKGIDYDLSASGVKAINYRDLLGLLNISPQFNIELDYTNNPLTTNLQKTIGKLYNIDPECILITNGSMEAMFLLMGIILEGDTEVIVEYPSFQPLFSTAQAFGAKTIFWQLREENFWTPELDELESLITNKTRMIIINHPHNPTGSHLDKNTFIKVIEIAESHKIFVLSDEVSRDLVFESDDLLLSAANISNQAISIGSLSKSFGIPGVRVGWMFAPKEIISMCRTARSYVSVCNSALSELIALKVIENSSEILSINRNLLRVNYELLNSWLCKNKGKFSWVNPKGGACLFPKYHMINMPSFDFCDNLARETGVLLLPGSVFGVENHFRLGFGTDTSTLLKGLDIIDHYFDRVIANQSVKTN